jgi:hypothetical protein
MPPFGTRFRSKLGPGWPLHAATHDIIGKAICRTAFATVGPGSHSNAPLRRPLLRLSGSACGGMAEMEATMTWKAMPSGRYLLASRRARFFPREADGFRILSIRTRVIWRPAPSCWRFA